MPLVKKTGKPVLSPDEEPQQEEQKTGAAGGNRS
jgi:hypothetical protein